MTLDEIKKLSPGQIIVSYRWGDVSVDTIKKVNERKVTVVASDTRFIGFADIILSFPADQGAQARKFADGLRDLHRERRVKANEINSWYINQRRQLLELFRVSPST